MAKLTVITGIKDTQDRKTQNVTLNIKHGERGKTKNFEL